MADPKGQSKKLTHKQELFVAAFLGEAHGNATEAARIAGYRQPAVQGYENLRKPYIAARIEQTVEKAGITAEAILAELADVGFADWRDFVEVIARDKTGKPTKVRMDLTNKVKSLELLGKHLQLFTEKQEIDINVREHRRAVPQSTIDSILQPADKRMDA